MCARKCVAWCSRPRRLGEPDSEPTGGVNGLDTPPPGRLTCCRPPRLLQARRQPCPLHDWGWSALLDCTRHRGWTVRPRWQALGIQGAPGREERCPALKPAQGISLGGGATVRVSGGGQRAHHPSDRSVALEGGGGTGEAHGGLPGCGGEWGAKTVKRPPQQPAHPQCQLLGSAKARTSGTPAAAVRTQ